MSSLSSKYANLPDVAYDQPDVYETTEPPTEINNKVSEYTLNKDINTEKLSIGNAKEFFHLKDEAKKDKDALVENYKRALFRSYMLEQITGGLSVQSSAGKKSDGISSLQSNQLDFETAPEKLRRLVYEVNDLMKFAEEDESVFKEKEKAILMNAVLDLQTKLDHLSNKKFQENNNLTNTDDNWKAFEQAQNIQTSSNSKGNNVLISDFEKRISKLELLLGPALDGSEAEMNQGPLLTTVTDLSTKTELLTNPLYLDSVSKRIKLASFEIEKLLVQQESLTKTGSQKKSDGDMDEDYQTAQDVLDRVNQEKAAKVYEILPQIEPMISLFPNLVNRLETLSGIHTKAASIVESFDHVDTTIQEEKTKIKHLNNVLETLKSSVESNSVLLVENVKALESKLLLLDERINKLS
ncbi:hypothetical protein BB558_001444 [Smittium angustum]|uniref:Dynactin subunit 2 n=1 Tax=Smittium angustum TaxID=133377 RepID=A0A2U1JBN3_SMIAN|nr:hypothetical protein BB558_001444 [Smittium angustum]